MTGSRTAILLAAGLALGVAGLPGRAEASKAGAQAMCVILDQTGELKSKCRVSNGRKAVDIRIEATAETAAEACPELVGVAHDLKLPFAAGWTLRIFPPGNSRKLLAQCGF